MFGPTQRLLKVFFLVGLILAFYAVARLEFLVWNWNLFHSQSLRDILWAFVVGLRFDLAAAMSLSAPLLLWAIIPWPQSLEKLWRWSTWGAFVLLGWPFFILNLVDTEFINFVGRRFTYDSLFILGEAQGKLSGFVSTYWFLFLLNTILVGFYGVASYKLLQKKSAVFWRPAGRRQYLVHGVLSFAALVLAVIAIRGGLQSKPLSFVHANTFAAPLLNNLSLNSSFTFIKSYGAQDLSREKYYDDAKEMLSYLNGSMRGSLLGDRPKAPQNVVIIILESFGLEYIGPHQGVTYTPFLDELSKRSLSFSNAFANGRRSIEGVAAIMGGIPALMREPFISSHFTSNDFLGLGTLLSANGYPSSFFHGGHNGTMYFDSFMQSAGIEKYFGSNEYNNPRDDDGIWGIWDEPFLQWMLRKLDEEKSPFLTSVFTLSSHHPFRVPPQYAGQFPTGPEPILQTIAYTDFALSRFFAEAEKKPWFNETLFILTADHTSKHYRPEFENELGHYRVPLILFHPSHQLPAVDPTMVVQHIDVLPTVLDFLGVTPKKENYMGSSVFVPGDKVAVNYIDGRYFLVARDYQLTWIPGRDPEMFALQDVNQKQPLVEPVNRKAELFAKLKAQIQYFNEGMWDNRLYYPSNH